MSKARNLSCPACGRDLEDPPPSAQAFQCGHCGEAIVLVATRASGDPMGSEEGRLLGSLPAFEAMKKCLARDARLGAVKALRSASGLGLKEAKVLVDRMAQGDVDWAARQRVPPPSPKGSSGCLVPILVAGAAGAKLFLS